MTRKLESKAGGALSLNTPSEASSRVQQTVRDGKIEVGQWYWVTEGKYHWLGCVTHLGSNYVKVESEGRHIRISFEGFDSYTTIEPDPEGVIDRAIVQHQQEVRRLLNEIKQLTAHLGIQPLGALPDPQSSSTALVAAHGTKNIKAHKAALILAKEKTLPDLFKLVEAENKAMAYWMKNRLVPLNAEARVLKSVTNRIENQIFTVELYAGLCEELTKIQGGDPAGLSEKIRLFQRRHYMDEECLANYDAGGMEFKDIEDFDSWLVRPENFQRILPMPRCVVAFRVRRRTKEREVTSLQEFIKVYNLQQLDEITFLYLRNGDQCYRLNTSIDFGAELFPDAENSHLMGGRLYVRNHSDDFITEQRYWDTIEEKKKRKLRYEKELAGWEKKPKDQRGPKPWYYDDQDQFKELNPQHLYYDDVMQNLAQEVLKHNRIAVVLQGLLDRSPAFHPHPPWKLWTPEGFTSGVELFYDHSRGLTDGDAPDFEAYRSRLNQSITRGTNTVGQQIAWETSEAQKENDRQNRDYRVRNPHEYQRFMPYGNPGPGDIARVQQISRDKSKCLFVWERERSRIKWVPNPDRPGWLMPDKSGVGVRFYCPIGSVLNVDAYTPGDYRQFYQDPRTRTQYLKWAPLLLPAEDFHKRKSG